MEPIPSVEPQTKEIMSQMIDMEKLAEDILSSKTLITEYERRRSLNKDALGALTRGEVDPSPKLWMNFCSMFVKVSRKQLLSMIESDQTRLMKAINEEREQMRLKIKKLHELNPNVIELDPYVRDLLMREAKIKEREAKTGKKVQLQRIEEIGSENEEEDS